MAQGDFPKQARGRDAEEEAQPLNEQQIGAEFAKALQELAKGEQTASSLESRLDDIESRIDRLLASAEEHAREATMLKTSEGNSAQASSKPKPA